MKILEIILILITSISTILFGAQQAGTICLFVYMALCIVDILRVNSLNLFHIWIVSFVFIICSDIVLHGAYEDSWSSIILINANNIFLIGYLSRRNRNQLINDSSAINDTTHNKKPIVVFFIIVLLLVYVLYFWRIALNSFLMGRIQDPNASVQESQFVLMNILNSIGLVLPSVICYYYHVYLHKNILIPLFLSMPIFILLFMMGTRFPLLFSALGFVIGGNIINTQKVSFKNLLTISVVGILLIASTSQMKLIRHDGVYSGVNTVESIDDLTFSQKISTKMSSEGIVEMLNYEHRYFKDNPHTYGLSTGFIFYFWVPRAIWHNKPTMIGYWLPRQYFNLSAASNVSFGFLGEPYADFGYFSLILMFFMGRGLNALDQFQSESLRYGSSKSIIASILFPYVFFFVRSPVTSTTTLVGALVVYYIFSKLFKSRV